MYVLCSHVTFPDYPMQIQHSPSSLPSALCPLALSTHLLLTFVSDVLTSSIVDLSQWIVSSLGQAFLPGT